MLAGYLFKLSLKLRHNPFRFLFRDVFVNLSGTCDPPELEFMQREWPGDIWDLGASVGKFTTLLAASNPRRTVYAFEPNLNSLYYLAYRTARFPNVVIVACALTRDGATLPGTYDPDFTAPATGPRVVSLSLREALQKFGRPAFIKMDIEGGEFELFRQDAELLRGVHLWVEWHPGIVNQPRPPLNYWKVSQADSTHTYLEPL
jgi:FkbM family methyltransferase